MLRTILAGTAVAGALVFGGAGIAGATTPSAPTTTPTTAAPSSGPNSATPAVCAKLPAVATRCRSGRASVNAALPKVQAREAKLDRGRQDEAGRRAQGARGAGAGAREQGQRPPGQGRGQVWDDRHRECAGWRCGRTARARGCSRAAPTARRLQPSGPADRGGSDGPGADLAGSIATRSLTGCVPGQGRIRRISRAFVHPALTCSSHPSDRVSGCRRASASRVQGTERQGGHSAHGSQDDRRGRHGRGSDVRSGRSGRGHDADHRGDDAHHSGDHARPRRTTAHHSADHAHAPAPSGPTKAQAHLLKACPKLPKIKQRTANQ